MIIWESLEKLGRTRVLLGSTITCLVLGVSYLIWTVERGTIPSLLRRSVGESGRLG